MPPPVLTYQRSRVGIGRPPASAHRRSSAACVPLKSPRATKRALAAAILRNAATASCVASIFAGSFLGPTTTKSLYMTSRRTLPKPFRMNCSSRALSCTSTTSHFAALADLERLAGADGNNIDIDAARLPKRRYEVAQQARLLRRRGRGDRDERIILGGERR